MKIAAPKHDVYAGAIARATEIVGGVAQLSALLQVARKDLKRWIRGDAKPEASVMGEVVDLLLEYDMGRFGTRAVKYRRRQRR
jgi:hypothetical protein